MIWHHPAATRRFRPWKNGGGRTAEIAVSPQGAGSDDFAWRISTAIVAGSGPFSMFPGVDRVLTVLEGGPMRLMIEGRAHDLAAGSPPLDFPGDVAVEAVLTGPELLDFNVMVRRPLRAAVRCAELAKPAEGVVARFALLLEDAGGFARLDLIDLHRAPAGIMARLDGARILEVIITDDVGPQIC